jgi:hypothetical protein
MGMLRPQMRVLVLLQHSSNNKGQGPKEGHAELLLLPARLQRDHVSLIHC